MYLTTTIMDLKHDLSKVIDKLVNVEQGQENLNHKIKENGQEVKDKIDSISYTQADQQNTIKSHAKVINTFSELLKDNMEKE